MDECSDGCTVVWGCKYASVLSVPLDFPPIFHDETAHGNKRWAVAEGEGIPVQSHRWDGGTDMFVHKTFSIRSFECMSTSVTNAIALFCGHVCHVGDVAC